MYKVFINDKTIYLTKKTSYTESETTTVYKFTTTTELEEVFFSFKDNPKKQVLIICGKKKKKLLNKFISCFKLIDAAGGLVRNKQGEYLFIFRRGKWDLPKGKTESFESIENTALREVEEECGIKDLKITSALPETYHIYFHDDKWIIKQTFWYEMYTDSIAEPVPQTSEDITEAKWFDMLQVKHLMENTYKSIYELVSYYFSLLRK